MISIMIIVERRRGEVSLFLAEGYQICMIIVTTHLCLIESSRDVYIGEFRRQIKERGEKKRKKKTNDDDDESSYILY